MDHLIRYLL